MSRILTVATWLVGRGLRHLSFQAQSLLLLALPTLSGCYVAKLGYHQNNLMNSRRVIVDIIADPLTTPDLREALLRVQKILAFAAREGLNSAGAYRYFVHTDGPMVSYLVQAAYPDRLESVTWWFPIVGRVPYRGYFDEAERDSVASELAAEGYDVVKSGVGAFSSLGWFDDPIYSAMVKRPEGSLALLLFHELTHRTYWSPGSAQFNENLAEFVAEILTVQYLTEEKLGAEIERLKIQKADATIYHQWLVALKAELEAMYARLKDSPRHEILREKARIFANFTGPRRAKFSRFDFIGKDVWNNARVLGASLYSPDFALFDQAFRCHSGDSAGAFLQRLKEAREDADNDFDALKKICEK